MVAKRKKQTMEVVYDYPTSVNQELKEHWEQYGYKVRYRQPEMPKESYKKNR